MINVERCDFTVATNITNEENKIMVFGGYNFKRNYEWESELLRNNYLTSVEEYSTKNDQ